MRSRPRWARTLAVLLAFAFGLALAAQPALAAPPPRLGAGAPAKTPLATAAAAKVAALTPQQLASVSPQTSDTAPATSSPSFFKTPKGIAVLLLVAAGVGYSAYAAVDDRKPVKSPIR